MSYSQFFINNDKFYWDAFLQNTDTYTLWLYYSQNIELKEKNQQTLHNTLLQYPKNYPPQKKNHITDGTNRDSVMTFEIIQSIIYHHPEIQKVVII